MSDELPQSLQAVGAQLQRLKEEITKTIFGQDAVIEQMIIALLCRGHALLEGVPGTAKTLAVRTMAMALSCRAKRIQFTPDLMPSDIVGTNVFNLADNVFQLHKGPVFTDLLLADEINRSPAKTQSALLEAMSERHTTIDGTRYELSPVFTVFATQNPIELEGTYPLPEAQLDRFLLKIQVGYPLADAEKDILEAFHRGDPPDEVTPEKINQVFTIPDMQSVQASLAQIRVEAGIMDYILKIVRTTRENDSILIGAGPRGSIYLLLVSKARALLDGRDFVTPDDVVTSVNPVLAHRLTLSAEAEIGGTTREEILQNILDKIEVPR